MEPAAPGRLSITTCCFICAESDFAITRAAASVPPPGGNGTTRRIGFSGYAAPASSGTANMNTPRQTLRNRLILIPHGREPRPKPLTLTARQTIMKHFAAFLRIWASWCDLIAVFDIGAAGLDGFASRLENVAPHQRRMAAFIRRRITHIRAQHLRRSPRPAWVGHHPASNRDEVGLAFDQHGFREFGLVEQPDGHGDYPGLAPNALGKRHLISRPGGDFLLRRKTAGRCHDIVAAERFQLARERNAVGEIPSAVDPISRRNAHPDRPLLRPGRTDRPIDFERKAHAPLEVAAVAVLPQIGQGRQKRVQQVTMRGVKLEHIEAYPPGTPSRFDKYALKPRQAVLIGRLDRVLSPRIGRAG